jgi:hypothetical protein
MLSPSAPGEPLHAVDPLLFRINNLETMIAFKAEPLPLSQVRLGDAGIFKESQIHQTAGV